jgi:hypothetical protein
MGLNVMPAHKQKKTHYLLIKRGSNKQNSDTKKKQRDLGSCLPRLHVQIATMASNKKKSHKVT